MYIFGYSTMPGQGSPEVRLYHLQHQCEDCSQWFATNKELKNHLASKHDGLRVVCPYCTRRQNCFRRCAELKRHIDQSHRYAKQMESLYGENASFYYALNPKQYTKVIIPANPDSKLGLTAKSLVLEWLEKVEFRPIRTSPEFLKGWDQYSRRPTVPGPLSSTHTVAPPIAPRPAQSQ